MYTIYQITYLFIYWNHSCFNGCFVQGSALRSVWRWFNLIILHILTITAHINFLSSLVRAHFSRFMLYTVFTRLTAHLRMSAHPESQQLNKRPPWNPERAERRQQVRVRVSVMVKPSPLNSSSTSGGIWTHGSAWASILYHFTRNRRNSRCSLMHCFQTVGETSQVIRKTPFLDRPTEQF